MGQYGDKLIKTGKRGLAHHGRMSLLLFVSMVILSSMFLHKWNYLFALIISVIFFAVLKVLKWFPRVGTKVENNLLINLGFQEIDLYEMDWGGDEIQKILNTLLHANNDAVLKQMRAIYRNYTENYSANTVAYSSSPGADLSSYVMSFAFSKQALAGNFSLKGMLLEEMRSIIINDIGDSMGKNPDTELKSEIRSAILLEIWFADIPMEKCYWLMKPYIGGEKIQATHGIRVKPEGKMAGVALVSQNYNSTDGSFDINDKSDKIAFNKRIPVMIGPRSLETGVIDIYSKTESGRFTINDVMQGLHQKLLLDVTEYNSPFPMINRWVSDKGGFIEFAGHFNAGKFFPAQKNRIYQSSLKKNLPNIFQNADIPIVSGAKKVENLLQEFVIDNQPIVQGVLAGEGNFEIEYRKSQNGRKRQYHIKKLNWMTKYCPKDNYNSNIFSDWKNYCDFRFDQDNYAPIPFTEGYLMTGLNENEWLCLFLAAGSPADAGDGFSKGADDQLNLYLNAYARQNGITNLIPMIEATQGLVVKGKRGADICYIKLINPGIASSYSTDLIIKLLLEKDIIPPVVKIVRINRYGKEDPNGVLLFQTKALPSMAEEVNGKSLGVEMGWKSLLKLATFSKDLIDHEIVCTDFTLKDTVKYEENGKLYLFVCDYGSYIKVEHFKRKNLVCKPEYESPEDKYDDVWLLPEPYQVFKLGILFYQFITSSSYQFPGLDFHDKETYGESLKKRMQQLSAGFSRGQQKMITLVSSMLSYEPGQRPSLQQVIDNLNNESKNF